MEWVRITAPDQALYGAAMNIYAESFPRHEQRARASQEKILSHPDYHFTCLCEEGRLLGILLYWQTEQFFYVEHFAVDPRCGASPWAAAPLPCWRTARTGPRFWRSIP